MESPEKSGRRMIHPGCLLGIALAVIVPVLLAGTVFFNVDRRVRNARKMKALADIEYLAQAVSMFHIDTGSYPGDLQDLVSRPADTSGWDGPYVQRSVTFLDPWGSRHVHTVTGDGFTVISHGTDGAEGGTGDYADLSSER